MLDPLCIHNRPKSICAECTPNELPRPKAEDIPAPSPLTLADLIQPLFGRIVIQVETKAEWTPSGLYIPVDTARTVHEQRATQGKVVAVSWGEAVRIPSGSTEGIDLEPGKAYLMDDDDEELSQAPHAVSVGDTVLFGKYTGTKITWQPDRTKDRQDVIIMQERDVLAVLHSPEQARNIKVKA